MSTELLTSTEIIEAINNCEIPEGATGVECVPNKWVDGIDVVTYGPNDWDDDDAKAMGRAFRWDFTGRCDSTAEAERDFA